MTSIDTWRVQLKHDLATFAPLAAQDPAIDRIYGITAAAVLWGVRNASFDDDQLETLARACGGPLHLELLKQALGGWDAMTPREAARSLSSRQHQSDELREALAAVMGRFIDDLIAEKMLRQEISVEGNVSGANNLIGGKQVILGDQIIQYIQQKTERTCPKPPSMPDKFGGRQERLKQIADGIRAGTNTAITAMHGVGGIGKTTLAQALAHELYEDKTFRAVLWADVTRNPDAGGILSAWVIGHADSSFNMGSFPTLKQAALAAKVQLDMVIDEKCATCDPPRVLVVLDDVWDNGLEAARTLRLACPEHSTILITTRSENVGQDLNAETESLTYMTPDESVDMLALYLSEADVAALKRLGTALGGHALAMELAARRIRKERHPGESDGAKLERCIGEYETGIPAGSPFDKLKLEQGKDKEDNLKTSLAYSYEDLDADDRRRFRSLGILAYDASFDAALLAALWDLPLEAVYDAADRLRLLSLLEIDGERYRQHPLLRAYARALLVEQGETEDSFNRYADFVIDVTQQFRQLAPEQWSTLDPQIPHIHTVGDALADLYSRVGTLDDALTRRVGEFSWNTMRYLNYRPAALFVEVDGMRQPQRVRWFEMGLAVWQHLNDPEREATTLNNVGLAWDALGEKRKALGYYEQVLPLCRAVGDREGEATTLNNIGLAWSAMGEKHHALEYYEQALSLRRRLGYRGSEATTLNNIGLAWSELGEQTKALRYYEHALSIFQTMGDHRGKAMALNNMGGVWSDLGGQWRALEYYEQALPLFRTIGDRGSEAMTLTNMGSAWDALGEFHKALECYDQALFLYRVTGVRLGEAATLTNIGIVWAALGEARKALEYFGQALPLRRAVEDRRGEATTLTNTGRAWLALGEPRHALEFHEQALPLNRIVGDRRGEAMTLNNMGSIYDALGEKRKALMYYKQSLLLCRAVEDRRGEAIVLNNIGDVYCVLKETRKGLEYYGQALAFQHALGDRSGEATTLNNMGNAYEVLGQMHKALQHYEQALLMFQKLEDHKGEGYALHNISSVFEAFRDLDRAVECEEQSARLLESIEDVHASDSRANLERLKRLRDSSDSQQGDDK
jgi:tetratricopeptide (TPR) repeat protein